MLAVLFFYARFSNSYREEIIDTLRLTNPQGHSDNKTDL